DPHHPQREIFLGEGGVDANGDPLTGPNSPHTNAAALRCIQCHVFEEHPPDPTIENPVNTGHTFLANNLAACAQPGCHPTEQDAETKRDDAQAAFDALAAQVAQLLSSIDRGSLDSAGQESYDIAKFDFDLAEAGASRGVHNTEYSMTLLNTALAILQSL
ncbi:MAG: hypothetical protein PVH68_12910, partial [Armatimonadota bacterium]